MYRVDKGLKVIKLKLRLFVFGAAALSGPGSPPSQGF